jgi:hypothetical protein
MRLGDRPAGTPACLVGGIAQRIDGEAFHVLGQPTRPEIAVVFPALVTRVPTGSPPRPCTKMTLRRGLALSLFIGVTGEIHCVDAGYNIVLFPHPDSLKAETGPG